MGKLFLCRNLFLKVNISPKRWDRSITRVVIKSLSCGLSYDILKLSHISTFDVKENLGTGIHTQNTDRDGLEMSWQTSTKIYPKRENEERPTKNKMKANRWKKNLKTWTLSGGEVELKNGQQWRGVPHMHVYMQKSNILSYIMVIAQPFCSWMRQKIHVLQLLRLYNLSFQLSHKFSFALCCCVAL